MKKYALYILIFFILVVSSTPLFSLHASQANPQEHCNSVDNPTNKPCVQPYHLLAPLPDPAHPGTDLNSGGGLFPSDTNSLGKYLNLMITIFIGLCAVLAVIMIVIGGIEYMTSELLSSKEHGRERLTNAVLGLLVALGAYALLYTINPDILSVDLKNLDQATITVDMGGENISTPFAPINRATLQARGITTCTGSGGKSAVESIGQQFVGKSTYSQTARNTFSPSTIYLDCSSFVDQVYACAGLTPPGNNTNAIFGSGATPVVGATLDETKLHPGDLLGWKPSDDKYGNGHVVIYIGNGKIIDASSTAGGVQERSLSTIKNRITYAKWPN